MMRVYSLMILLVLMTACTPLTAPETDAPESDEQMESTASPAFDVLAFEGNGDTFLAHVDSVIGERGRPEGHRLVEVITADGAVWQGEALRYPEAQVILLQQAQAGGETAIALETPLDADLAAILAAQDPPVGQPLYSAHPQIQFVRARMDSAGEWSFDVTLTYPDKGWEDYADGWHIETPGGEILGTRILLHPHVNEQPFTRSLSGVAIPNDLDEVVVRSHNLVSGYAPETVVVKIGESGEGERYEVVR